MIEKELLEKLITENVSANKIAKQLDLSLSTVRYWLKKYGLKTNYTTFKSKVKNNFSEIDGKTCPMCKIYKTPSEFYFRRDKTNFSPYCKPCTGLQTLDRQRKFKADCVEYKGGKCINCGYNKYFGALEFHHLDPSKKDFHIAKARMWKLDNIVKQELDKCALLCANCHREAHSTL